MRVTVLGGASFLGYWIKEGLRKKSSDTQFQIIDAPRNGLSLVKKVKDNFIFLNSFSENDIISFHPNIIVINLYDLLNFSSLSYSILNNNILIGAINSILNVSKKLNSRIILITNKNLYTQETILNNLNQYYQTYNTYNSFYFDYLRTYSKVYKLKMNIFLLPNIFGMYEPSESVVSTLTSHTLRGTKVKLTDTKREFIYIKRLMPEVIRHILLEPQDSIIKFSANQFTEVTKLYKIMTKLLQQSSIIDFYEDKISLEEMYGLTDATVNIIDSVLDKDLKDYFSNIVKY